MSMAKTANPKPLRAQVVLARLEILSNFTPLSTPTIPRNKQH